MTHEINANPSDSIFVGDSEMALLMRSYDWSQTPLGSVETWSQSLKTAVRIMVTSRQAMFVWWGEELINLYNDAYRSILVGKHPEALGQPAAIVWREIWEQVSPRAETALRQNQGTYDEALLLIMERNGYPEETYYTFSYSPIPDDDGSIGGIICANTEDTPRIIGERQLALLKELAAKTADARTFDAACTLSATCLETNPYDLPFALIYLFESNHQYAVLAGTSGVERGHTIAPETVAFEDGSVWSFTEVVKSQQICLVSDLDVRFQNLPTGAWNRSPHQAAVVPIAPSGQMGRAGILVIGLNPFRLFDDQYRGFINLVSAQIAASIANAQTYEEERKRAEALAELDRAKTAFFSNISHEFRTPLTLMMSPLEELSNTLEDRLQPDEREQLQLIQRNGLRLQKLVNTLLDFSRIEAGRMQASYEPTDLAAYTAELASIFRSLIERAGMSLVIDCPPLPEAVYVDRQMWEKIVLNLISNAFKFTFAGRITVRLQLVGKTVELSVADTGVGVPNAELPKLFERFHQVHGTRSRTFEGSGIGLALVQELVKLHGGTIRVSSQLEQGTTFTIAIPLGSAHLPSERITQATYSTSTSTREADPYLVEASRWLPERNFESPILDAGSANDAPTSHLGTVHQPSQARILLVDDNADMRNYVKRLLSQSWDVEAVSNGLAALEAVAQRLPDLVLSDVMMPGLDGFGLLRELRANPRTQEIPIILLSARAGAESRIEGLDAGADDYLIKPFSARELLARVEATLRLAQLRHTTAQQEQTLRLEAESAQKTVETILSSIRDGFYTLDRNWRYTYVNDRLCEMAGKSREELLGHNNWEVFPEVVGTDIEVQFHRAMREQTPLQFEYFYAPWNRWFEYRVYPSTDGLTIFLVEVTDRKQAEAALQESERRFRRLVESNMFGVAFGGFSGEFRYANDYFLKMVGYTREEVETGQVRWLDITPAEFLPLDERAAEELRIEGVATPFEKEYIRKDGTRVPILIGATLLQASYSQQQEIICFYLDLTERKQAEAERERLLQRAQMAKEEAEAANRVKDEFLAVVSHELRSPLNPILGWSRLLRSRQLDAQKTERALEVIERNAQMQAQLINDLLDVSSILRGRMSLDTRPVDLVPTIRAAIETVQLAAEAKAIDLRFTLLDFGLESDEPPNPPESASQKPKFQVIGDAGRLQQVVWNLLSNAVKFTPAGGQVEVRLARRRKQAIHPETDSIHPASLIPHPSSFAQITVTDTGQGINPDFLPYVFDHFSQESSATTRRFGGLGLGLAIVRYLVELHGGIVYATSQGEGMGATFTVNLPLLRQEGEREKDEKKSFSPPSVIPHPLKGVRVLVVDDDNNTREFFAFLLEQRGATVKAATGAGEAIAALSQFQPDLLLSDIGMPDVDGYTFIRQVRALPPEQGGNIPAIAVTAYAGEIDSQQAIAAGFQQHLAKPIEPEVLIQAIVALVR